MGWVNYIVVPIWKMKFVVTRNFKEDEEILKKIDILSECQEELQDGDILSKELNNLNLTELNTALNCISVINEIYFDEFPALGLIIFLKSRKIDFEIISETSQEMEKYKNFIMVE